MFSDSLKSLRVQIKQYMRKYTLGNEWISQPSALVQLKAWSWHWRGTKKYHTFCFPSPKKYEKFKTKQTEKERGIWIVKEIRNHIKIIWGEKKIEIHDFNKIFFTDNTKTFHIWKICLINQSRRFNISILFFRTKTSASYSQMSCLGV